MFVYTVDNVFVDFFPFPVCVLLKDLPATLQDPETDVVEKFFVAFVIVFGLIDRHIYQSFLYEIINAAAGKVKRFMERDFISPGPLKTMLIVSGKINRIKIRG